MPQVKLVRRWGSHPAGETVDVDQQMADHLLGTAFGVRPGNEDASRHGPAVVHPGADGPDNRAGGDPTRARMTSARSARVEQNLTGRVTGAPRPVGDVTHVAPENLGKEHKGDPNDVLLASGKRLTEDLEKQQQEIDEQDKKRASRQGEAVKPAPKIEPKASDESPQGEGRKLTQKPKG